MKIFDLKREPQHIDQLAQWHHGEWAYLNPNGSVEKRKEKMREYMSEDFIPSTFIAKLDDQLLGSAAIVESDMDTHKELTPWLASLYVCPDQRNQGIGSALVNYVIEQARGYGINTLYLFTPDKERFYENLGWTTQSKELYREHPVTIMAIKLND